MSRTDDDVRAYDAYCEAGNPELKCPRCAALHDDHDFGGLCEPCHAQLVDDGEIDDAGPEPDCSCGPVIVDPDDVGFPCNTCGGMVR